jgi:hypothetical protein
VMSSLHRRGTRSIRQTDFFVGELTELFDVLLMLTAAPVLWEGNSGLKFRDLVVEFSRWVLGPKFLPTVEHQHPPNRWGEVNLLNHY